MYYHTHEIKYTTFGKILPPPLDVIDGHMLKCYQWLGKYCGFCSQIWLSRSKSCLTGYKNRNKQKGSKFFGKRKNFEPNVMFAFDIIKGFYVDFETWCYLLNILCNCNDSIKEGDDAIKKDLDEYYKDFLKDQLLHPEEILDSNDILYKWTNSNNYEDFLNKYLFIENDQVVVPSLNLKSAKKIFCRNERQVKELRHMGFIKDRIEILNSKQLW